MPTDTATPVPTAEDVATGYAKNSFDEAFADAIAHLPPFEPTHADTLQTIRVVEVGAELGGFAGLRHVYVRVSRTYD